MRVLDDQLAVLGTAYAAVLHPRGRMHSPPGAADGGRVEETEEVYREAVDAGHAGAVVNLGILLAMTVRVEEAEEMFRRAADGG
ncbi:hypothetical protein AB0D62_21120 [Streptomyces massasporeus]|uniref:hypothetical protein n=1 Tax=Streptomyces massasporeus TaxID=67324 RepID=UPI0033D7FE35